jgi:nucleoside-diphosphate-sugar epimerase
MSLVPARWEHVKRAVEIRDNFVDSKGNKSQALIFGNGDVIDIQEAEKIGWQPTIQLEEGIKKQYAYLKKELKGQIKNLAC